MNGFNVTEMPTLGFSTVDVPQVDQILDNLEKLAGIGAEVFPNQEITETIFGMMRLPTQEMEENIENAKQEAEEARKRGDSTGDQQKGKFGQRKDDEKEDDDEDDEDDDED
jgi:hypothetical protein